ncbi:MAG: hypothetical protein CM15mP8_0390 [Methanobacteriota archaeon]|nr:MAG: hypothetical protein CM15mP8_0390 [Euryarchaeota archaeon]
MGSTIQIQPVENLDANWDDDGIIWELGAG